VLLPLLLQRIPKLRRVQVFVWCLCLMPYFSPILLLYKD
jgi:hypothetical protein